MGTAFIKAREIGYKIRCLLSELGTIIKELEHELEEVKKAIDEVASNIRLE